MLEALLNHFRSYGMDDLEFIIVNSKLSHSQDKLTELTKRVSFEVYQETDEEEVWSVMEGGKDDMYVYDRCGRLTYYIPFPLSILNESPLVSNAILATYFRSPCGVTCDQNNTLEVEEIVKNIEDYETENNTQQDNYTYAGTELPFDSNYTTNDTMYSNNLLDVTFDENETVTNNTGNITDYDYSPYDHSSINETNNLKVDEANSYFSSIYRLFFSAKKGEDKTSEVNASLNDTSIPENSEPLTTSNHTNTVVNSTHTERVSHGHRIHGHDVSSTQGKKKSDRCQEADYQVCKSWSKKRLLHAQRCCSEIRADPESQDHRSCDNFGKKRCKKMQTILKCCIKTVYTEPTVGATTEEPAVPPAIEEPVTPVVTMEEHSTTTQIADVVCCKDVASGGKLCRVASAGMCEEGEYIERSPSLP